ncbi:hypothetical protein PHMEG_00023307 [Phytophthora megakarya]|uniref:Uncharacterized protein n=1 Tax=Phytophthora megakarya TaxID=4795 RepID=A0A225VJP5_9STRA|nr:hypothetical protein PHMEG_00023307 [Phytophthora megakarya]
MPLPRPPVDQLYQSLGTSVQPSYVSATYIPGAGNRAADAGLPLWQGASHTILSQPPQPGRPRSTYVQQPRSSRTQGRSPIGNPGPVGEASHDNWTFRRMKRFTSHGPAQSSTIMLTLCAIRQSLTAAGHDFPVGHPHICLLLNAIVSTTSTSSCWFALNAADIALRDSFGCPTKSPGVTSAVCIRLRGSKQTKPEIQ